MLINERKLKSFKKPWFKGIIVRFLKHKEVFFMAQMILSKMQNQMIKLQKENPYLR